MLRQVAKGASKGLGLSSGRTPMKQMQPQQRAMSSEDDGVVRFDWWSFPTNPDVWKKHHLAWWTIAFYSGVAYVATGGLSSKKEETSTK